MPMVIPCLLNMLQIDRITEKYPFYRFNSLKLSFLDIVKWKFYITKWLYPWYYLKHL